MFDRLRALGVTTVFGNPGSTELPMLHAFPPDFTYVLALQEASAVGMADAFALASGNAAFVNLHTGPGVGNAMGAIQTARANKAPVIVTAGQQTRELLAIEPFLTNRSPVELTQPHIKWAYEPSRGEDVPYAIERGYHVAMQQPRGPVFVSIPMDDWDTLVDPVPPRPVTHRWAPDPDRIAEFANALGGARRPGIIVGPDVDADGGYRDVVALAERVGATVWQSPESPRSSFPEDHPQYRGYLPPAQGPLADELGSHDVVLILGAPVFAYYPHVPGPVVSPGTRLLHVTTDADEAARAPVAESLVADTALAIRVLLQRLPTRGRRPPGRRPGPEVPERTEPMSAAYVFSQLSGVLPEDVIVVSESPSNLAAFHDQVRLRAPGSFYSTGSGGLGYGLPAAVGVALACPERPVLCVMGDGSTCYSPQAFYSAAQHHVPIVFVILDNSEYAILKAFSEFDGALTGIPGLDLPGLDLLAVARGFGVDGRRVRSADELDDALLDAAVAWRVRRPVVLVVEINSDIPALL